MTSSKPFEWLSNDWYEYLDQANQWSEFQWDLIQELLDEHEGIEIRWLRPENAIGWFDKNNEPILVLPALLAFIYDAKTEKAKWSCFDEQHKDIGRVPLNVLREIYSQYDANIFSYSEFQLPAKNLEQLAACHANLCECIALWLDAMTYTKLTFESDNNEIHLYFILLKPDG